MPSSNESSSKVLTAVASAICGVTVFCAVQANTAWAQAPDEKGTYPGYGYSPTGTEHLGEKEYSPYLDVGYPQRVFFGDTHLHTSYSTDAGMIGNRLGPEEAYRFGTEAKSWSPAPACGRGCSVHWISWSSPTTRKIWALRR